MQQNTYKNYLLVVLLVILAFNYVDRLALGIVLQDIKLDLGLSDTQLGFLTGIAFAIFYAVMGLPLARWADRGNRITIIAVTAALWSTAVALCGAAGNFTQLLLIRIGIAVGEAGCQPPALSLISDHFSRAERPRAVARYKLGWPLALLGGFFSAGWLNEFYGWRLTFVILGLPGLVLAVLAAITLKEPRRVQASALVPAASKVSNAAAVVQTDLASVVRALWSNAAYRHLLICMSLVCFFTTGILQWQPAFFMRSHGLQSGPLGTWLSLVYGLCGLLGTYIGGELASRYAASNERLQLQAIAVVYVALAVLAPVVYLAPDYRAAFAVLAVFALAGGAANGPLYAAIQTVVPAHMRATSTAVVFFFFNLIGMGFGPLAAGALSDALRPLFGEDSLRYALVTFGPGYLWCAAHLWQASKTALRDAAAAQSTDNAREPDEITGDVPLRSRGWRSASDVS
jgi:MFS family permease